MDTYTAGIRGTPEATHPGEVLPDDAVFWFSGQQSARREASGGVSGPRFECRFADSAENAMTVTGRLSRTYT
jgi:hypothetical protein